MKRTRAMNPGGQTPEIIQLTRRGFVRGSAKLLASSAALAVLGGAFGLSGCSSDDGDSEIQVLDVPENAVVTLDSFREYENPNRYCEVSTVGTFNEGTLLSASNSRVAAALCPGETADPLNTVGLIQLRTGRLTTVLDQAVGHDDGYTFYNATASEELLVWVESNFLTSDWAVYCATIEADEQSIGQPVQIDSGNVDYDAPEIAAIGPAAYWIVQPAENGEKTTEDSLLKASSGGSAAAIIHTSHGRFNGGLSVSGDVLTAMPRADAESGIYYQLTAFQSGTGAVVASQVLPRSFRPTCAVYMNNAFSFSIGASYDYGGGIANVGTYYPLDANTWLRLTRQPVTPPGLCQGWLFSKSGSRTALVDLEGRGYFTVDAPSGSADYGDYPVAVGECDRIYVYATVSEVEDSEEITHVEVRSIRIRSGQDGTSQDGGQDAADDGQAAPQDGGFDEPASDDGDASSDAGSSDDGTQDADSGSADTSDDGA